MAEVEIIDVIGREGGVIEIDARTIAAIVHAEYGRAPERANRTANRIVRYLVDTIAQADARRPQ